MCYLCRVPIFSKHDDCKFVTQWRCISSGHNHIYFNFNNIDNNAICIGNQRRQWRMRQGYSKLCFISKFYCYKVIIHLFVFTPPKNPIFIEIKNKLHMHRFSYPNVQGKNHYLFIIQFSCIVYKGCICKRFKYTINLFQHVFQFKETCKKMF